MQQPRSYFGALSKITPCALRDGGAGGGALASGGRARCRRGRAGGAGRPGTASPPLLALSAAERGGSGGASWAAAGTGEVLGAAAEGQPAVALPRGHLEPDAPRPPAARGSLGAAVLPGTGLVSLRTIAKLLS